MLSPDAEREFVELANSESFRNDMETVGRCRWNPFVREGKFDVDAYLAFLADYNEFIGHEPRPFKPMVDKHMLL